MQDSGRSLNLMPCHFTRKEKVTHRRRQCEDCEDGGRDWSDAKSQEIPKATSSYQTLRERHGTDSSSESPEGTNPANSLM